MQTGWNSEDWIRPTQDMHKWQAFVKMCNELSVQGISWLAEELLASQDRLCSMDTVCGFSEDTGKPSSRFHRSKSFYPDEYLPCKTLYYFFQPTNKADYVNLTGGGIFNIQTNVEIFYYKRFQHCLMHGVTMKFIQTNVCAKSLIHISNHFPVLC